MLQRAPMDIQYGLTKIMASVAPGYALEIEYKDNVYYLALGEEMYSYNWLTETYQRFTRAITPGITRTYSTYGNGMGDKYDLMNLQAITYDMLRQAEQTRNSRVYEGSDWFLWFNMTDAQTVSARTLFQKCE